MKVGLTHRFLSLKNSAEASVSECHMTNQQEKKYQQIGARALISNQLLVVCAAQVSLTAADRVSPVTQSSAQVHMFLM